jgi:predicted transcriptional regulator of viral defense system
MGQFRNTEEHPNWDQLFETASAQDGYFSTAQASEAGYSSQLLVKYLKSGRITRIRRGVYRLVHFPAGEHEELVVIWLWAERAAIFSHETALAVHGLSDVMPAKVHITLPVSWQHRRLRVPAGVVLHFSDFQSNERTWFGAIPVTTAAQTLIDCAANSVAPEFVRDAFEQAANRGLVKRDSLPSVIAYLKQYFSVSRGRSGPRFRSASGEMARRSK